MSRDRTGNTSDGDALGCFVVLVAGNTTDDRSGDSAEDSIALRIGLS
jgi:hypothetical protein